MRTFRPILAIAAVTLLFTLLAAGTRPIGGGSDPARFDQDRDSTIGPGDPSVPAPTTPSQDSDAPFRLVGFTTTLFPGSRGVLNYTLACQTQFPDSRMCTFEEISDTVVVPEAPGIGYAWMRMSSTNCRDWTSSSADDDGVAISLGCDGCYGGAWIRSCDTPLAVACCAPLR